MGKIKKYIFNAVFHALVHISYNVKHFSLNTRIKQFKPLRVSINRIEAFFCLSR